MSAVATMEKSATRETAPDVEFRGQLAEAGILPPFRKEAWHRGRPAT